MDIKVRLDDKLFLVHDYTSRNLIKSVLINLIELCREDEVIKEKDYQNLRMRINTLDNSTVIKYISDILDTDLSWDLWWIYRGIGYTTDRSIINLIHICLYVFSQISNDKTIPRVNYELRSSRVDEFSSWLIYKYQLIAANRCKTNDRDYLVKNSLIFIKDELFKLHTSSRLKLIKEKCIMNK